jgi:hypothetical protein
MVKLSNGFDNSTLIIHVYLSNVEMAMAIVAMVLAIPNHFPV